MLTLLMSIIFSACEKSDLLYENDYERSYKVWQAFKFSCGDTYRYQVSGSTWTGNSWLTSIYVKDGVVVQRNFYYTIFNGIQRPSRGWTIADSEEFLQKMKMTSEDFYENFGYPLHEALEWFETEERLGTNEHSPASPLYTLDDVYATAKLDWLKKRADAKIIFETKNNGIISAVGYIPDGCVDDCFHGLYIESVEHLY